MTNITLQQYTDETLDAIGLSQFKQPLKNLIEVFETHGWKIERVGDTLVFPDHLMIKGVGQALSIYDPETGKFARDVTGPLGDNMLAPAYVDEPVGTPDGVRSWIVGTREINNPDNDPVENAFASERALRALAELLAKRDADNLMRILASLVDDKPVVTPGLPKVGGIA